MEQYNEHRPHRSLDLRPPFSKPPPAAEQAPVDGRGPLKKQRRSAGSDATTDSAAMLHEFELAA